MLSIFRNIHRKTPVFESLFTKVTGLNACSFIKKRLRHRCFPVKFPRILRTSFFKESRRWLLQWVHLLSKNLLEKLLSESILKIFDTSYLPLQNKKFNETFQLYFHTVHNPRVLLFVLCQIMIFPL